MALINQPPHLVNGVFSYDKLIAAIEKLESDGVISFEEFKKLPYYEIKRQYFSMPQPTMIEKAKIMVEDKRSGKEGPSEYISSTITIEEGKPDKIIKRIHRF